MPGLAQANEEKTTTPIIQHLEFLGYQCKEVEQGIRATHPTKLGFFVVVLKDGLIAQSAITATDVGMNGVKREDPSQLATVNALNRETTIARFFWGKSGEFVMRASILGAYDKDRFNTFMEAWEKDRQVLSKHYDTLKAYLK